MFIDALGFMNNFLNVCAHLHKGYMRLKNVRIPRKWMLMKNQRVDSDGKYKTRNTGKGSKGKLQYSTMLMIRAGLVMSAGHKLMQGVVIVTRYFNFESIV